MKGLDLGTGSCCPWCRPEGGQLRFRSANCEWSNAVHVRLSEYTWDDVFHRNISTKNYFLVAWARTSNISQWRWWTWHRHSGRWFKGTCNFNPAFKTWHALSLSTYRKYCVRIASQSCLKFYGKRSLGIASEGFDAYTIWMLLVRNVYLICSKWGCQRLG